MFTLWSDIDRLFNNSFADMLNDRMIKHIENNAFTGLNRMNLIDKGDSLEFIAELPGVDEKDMNLTVHNDTLTLSAKRNISRSKENILYLAERGNYDVRKSIVLPSRIDAEKTTASFKNGVLRVALPKAPESQPKQIAINA